MHESLQREPSSMWPRIVAAAGSVALLGGYLGYKHLTAEAGPCASTIEIDAANSAFSGSVIELPDGKKINLLVYPYVEVIDNRRVARAEVSIGTGVIQTLPQTIALADKPGAEAIFTIGQGGELRIDATENEVTTSCRPQDF